MVDAVGQARAHPVPATGLVHRPAPRGHRLRGHDARPRRVDPALEPDAQPSGRRRRVPRRHARRCHRVRPRKPRRSPSGCSNHGSSGTRAAGRCWGTGVELGHDDLRRRRARIETDNTWDESRRSRRPSPSTSTACTQGRAADPSDQERRVPHLPWRPARELADRCERTLDRAHAESVEETFAKQRVLDGRLLARSDVEIAGQPEVQQAVRGTSSCSPRPRPYRRARHRGEWASPGPATAVTTSWDMEIYVLPFLSYTAPIVARNALRFRYNMLDSARSRARELNQHGALFRGGRSTAKSPARTTPPAPRSTTSTPTSPMRSCSTCVPRVTPSS